MARSCFGISPEKIKSRHPGFLKFNKDKIRTKSNIIWNTTQSRWWRKPNSKWWRSCRKRGRVSGNIKTGNIKFQNGSNLTCWTIGNTKAVEDHCSCKKGQSCSPHVYTMWEEKELLLRKSGGGDFLSSYIIDIIYHINTLDMALAVK